MNIEYHNLSDSQFEDLVIELCKEMLGFGTRGFSSGKDGGRDAYFDGRANHFPSEADPWQGKIVIQAKHTQLLNKKFSEPDFCGKSAKSLLATEIPKIRSLVERGELDYYMLFANRRLTGGTDLEIRSRIAGLTGLASRQIHLFDTNELDSWIKRFPQAAECASLNPAKSPADVDPQDLAEIILALAQHKEELSDLLEGTEPPPEYRITPKQKNESNNLRKSYFENKIRPRMVDFQAIRKFLGHPENQPFVRLYEDTASEFEAKLNAWTDPDVYYEKQLEVLFERIFGRDFDLRKNRGLTRSVVYYMYCNCDIGGDAK